MVVVLPPVGGQTLRLPQIRKHLQVQQLIAQAAVETFGVTIFPRGTWFHVQRLDPGRRQVPADRAGDKLRAVVAADVVGHAALQEDLRQDVDHVGGRDGPFHLQGQALPRVLVDQTEDLQWAASLVSVVDEVPGPDVVLAARPLANDAVVAAAQSPFLVRFPRHAKLLLLPQAVHPLVIDSPAFGPQ